MLENGVRILELRILELCGEDIYRELSRTDVDKLLEVHKEKIVEKCYEIANREIEILLKSIKYKDKANECVYANMLLDKAYEKRSLDVIEILDWLFDLRIYC